MAATTTTLPEPPAWLASAKTLLPRSYTKT
jgi:hypothetical protein